MLTNFPFSIKEESKLLIGSNFMNETTMNNKSYRDLEEKNKKLISRFQGMTEKNDLIIYQTLNPIYLNRSKDMKFSFDKKELNELFLHYKKIRDEKEIYTSDLYELLNPYYLTETKRYLKRKHLSKEILAEFKDEQKLLYERNCNKVKNQFYDKDCGMIFVLKNKEDHLNKIKNKDLINNSIKENCFVVRLKNNEDNIFDKIFLLKPDFTIDELKILIKFIYKVKYEKQFISTVDLYYQDIFFNEHKIENVKNLGDLADKLKAKIELTIFIDAQY